MHKYLSTDRGAETTALYDAWTTALTARQRGERVMRDDYRYECLEVVVESLDRRLCAAIGLVTDARDQLMLIKRMLATGRDKPDPPDAA